MEFYDVIEKRRTTREFLDKEVDFEAIKRILELIVSCEKNFSIAKFNFKRIVLPANASYTS